MNTLSSDLLAIDMATLFVMTEAGRILHDNAPDRSAGPRLYLAGCATGNSLRVRHDVGADTARAIEILAADEPPLDTPGSTPVHLDEYIQLLASEAPVERCTAGLSWCFPDRLAYAHHVPLVGSDPPEGNGLLARLAERGMPRPLVELGFVSTSDFWAPWCVALHDGEIASIAFSARLGPQGAETGVTTIPTFRGRGFAAAATAGWSALPSLHGRALFYGTDVPKSIVPACCRATWSTLFWCKDGDHLKTSSRIWHRPLK